MTPPPLGTLGIWRRRQEGAGGLPDLEALGYSALWIGSSPSLADVRPFLEASRTLTVAIGILNVWQHDPADVAAQHAGLARDFPGRFLLGIGIGHPEATAEYRSPLAVMGAFFDGLDGAVDPVPREERAAAALGPRMLDLARERARRAHVLRHARAHADRPRAPRAEPHARARGRGGPRARSRGGAGDGARVRALPTSGCATTPPT